MMVSVVGLVGTLHCLPQSCVFDSQSGGHLIGAAGFAGDG